jgi:hypothetical protein
VGAGRTVHQGTPVPGLLHVACMRACVGVGVHRACPVLRLHPPRAAVSAITICLSSASCGRRRGKNDACGDAAISCNDATTLCNDATTLCSDAAISCSVGDRAGDRCGAGASAATAAGAAHLNTRAAACGPRHSTRRRSGAAGRSCACPHPHPPTQPTPPTPRTRARTHTAFPPLPHHFPPAAPRCHTSRAASVDAGACGVPSLVFAAVDVALCCVQSCVLRGRVRGMRGWRMHRSSPLCSSLLQGNGHFLSDSLSRPARPPVNSPSNGLAPCLLRELRWVPSLAQLQQLGKQHGEAEIVLSAVHVLEGQVCIWHDKPIPAPTPPSTLWRPARRNRLEWLA